MSVKLTRYNDLILDGEPLRGTWELTPDHEIAYRADDKKEEIRFKAPIIAAEPDALVVAATVNQDDQTVVTRTIKLTGRWKADGKNRLVFEAERTRGQSNPIVLRGTWKLNDAHEIVYTHRSEYLKPRGKKSSASRKIVHELVFRGYWEINDRRRITYTLAADSDSAFRFRGAFQTPSILAKKGEIRFQLGGEASVSAVGRRTITFFGAWKLSRDLNLSFELNRSEKRGSTLKFGGEIRLAGSNTLAVNLRSERGKPLGVELLFTRDFFKGNGELFARLARDAAETRVEAGARIRW